MILHSKFCDTEPSAWVESKACAANFAHMDDPGARLDLGGVRSAGALHHRPLSAHSGGWRCRGNAAHFAWDAEIPTADSSPLEFPSQAQRPSRFLPWLVPPGKDAIVSTWVLPETQRPPPAFHVYFILPADNRRPNIRFLFHPLLRRLISPL